MKKQMILAVAGVLMVAVAQSSETARVQSSEEIPARGTVFKRPIPSRDGCAMFTDGQFVKYVGPTACPDREAKPPDYMIKVGEHVDRMHLEADLGLTPRYTTPLTFPAGTKSIVITKEDGARAKLKYQARFGSTPNNGCIIALTDAATRASRFLPEMTIMLRKSDPNVRKYFAPDWIQPNERYWVMKSEKSGNVIGVLSCDTDITDKNTRSKLERFFGGTWDVFKAPEEEYEGANANDII